FASIRRHTTFSRDWSSDVCSSDLGGGCRGRMADANRLIKQGDIYWAALPAPRGSEPGHDRLVVVDQQTANNNSDIRTVLCVPLRSEERRVGKECRASSSSQH